MSRHAITRAAEPQDAPEVSALHARAFGPGRFARTAYRVREGTASFSPCCRVCVLEGRIIAAVRFTPITIGGKAGALLLGPLAVDPAFANQGYGRTIVREGLEAARGAGGRLVVLVGDEPYYGRLGFKRIPLGRITLSGPVNPDRLLALELAPDALAGFSGLIAGDRGPARAGPVPLICARVGTGLGKRC